MPPVRVAMLTQRYLPFVGGAEKQLSSVLQRLPSLGIEAMVITRRHDDSPVDDFVDGIPVHRVTVGGQRELASVTYTVKTLAALHRFRPDVVHAFELRSPATTAVAYRALSGTPVVAKVLRGGTLGDIELLSQSRLDRLRLSRVLRSIDAFAVISQEIDAELETAGVGSDRRHFIPNGVDVAKYRPASTEERTAARERLGLGAGPVALFAGRLEREKRIDDLIRLWPRIRQALPGATLAVVGTGSQEEELRRELETGVLLAGKQMDMGPWFAAADCFVLPSESEGLSNSLLEAMASGLPCVATSVGAAPELLGGGRGRLIAPDDMDALAKAIVGALSQDPASSATQAEELHQLISENYSIDATAKKLAALYRHLASPEPTQRFS